MHERRYGARVSTLDGGESILVEQTRACSHKAECIEDECK